jgi:hypothetical protein
LETDPQEDKKHQKRVRMRFELKLQHWTGTITYNDNSTGAIIATRPAHVYVSNELSNYDDSIEQGLVVRMAIGLPYSDNEEGRLKVLVQKRRGSLRSWRKSFGYPVAVQVNATSRLWRSAALGEVPQHWWHPRRWASAIFAKTVIGQF